MSRLPAHKARQNRQEIWQFIRKNPLFKIADITNATLIHHGTISTYIFSLCNAGIVDRTQPKYSRNRRRKRNMIHEKSYSDQVYKLVKDKGHTAPTVTRDGSPSLVGRHRNNMWRTMRMIKNFSTRELQIYASTEDCQMSIDTARLYISMLAKAGYLKKLPNYRYQFLPVMHTGPLPPIVQTGRRSVFDQNLGKIMWEKTT